MKLKNFFVGLAVIGGMFVSGCGNDTTVAGAPGANGLNGATGPAGILPVPTVAGATSTPGVGVAGGGTPITITGTNFVQGFTSVTIGGVAATNVVVAAGGTTLTAVTPAGVPGARNIVVTTPGGSATITNGFTYQNAVLLVSNSLGNSIVSFPHNATGNVAPARTLTDALSIPVGIFANAGELLVPTLGNSEIRIFSSTASGAAAPVRLIAGALTQLASPRSVSVSDNLIFTANQVANRITIHSLAATGNVPPLRVIEGANTGLDNPHDTFVGGNNLWVANTSGASVQLFDSRGSGNIAPLRTITGALTTLISPESIWVANGEVYVYDSGADEVAVFPVTADGNVAPSRRFTTPTANFGELLVFNGEIYWATEPNIVNVYLTTDTGTLPAPQRSITGALTTFNQTSSLAIDPTITLP